MIDFKSCMDELMALGRKPTRAEIREVSDRHDAVDRARCVRRMADDLLAGKANWAERVMRIEIGQAQRMQNEAIALAFKDLRK